MTLNFDLPHKGQNHYICFTSVTFLLFYWNSNDVLLINVYCMQTAEVYREPETRSMLLSVFWSAQELFSKCYKSSHFVLNNFLSLLIPLCPSSAYSFPCYSFACGVVSEHHDRVDSSRKGWILQFFWRPIKWNLNELLLQKCSSSSTSASSFILNRCLPEV